jgi:hypothetical protein
MHSRADEIMENNPVQARRKKYPGYNVVTVLWHESIPKEFDPVEALKALADSRGLVAKEKVNRASRRLRVDSVQSSKLRDARSLPADKGIQQEAFKLLRKALKNPQAVEDIKALVERARKGEDTSQGLSEAMDRDS